jgi:hypothetical protein
MSDKVIRIFSKANIELAKSNWTIKKFPKPASLRKLQVGRGGLSVGQSFCDNQSAVDVAHGEFLQWRAGHLLVIRNRLLDPFKFIPVLVVQEEVPPV